MTELSKTEIRLKIIELANNSIPVPTTYSNGGATYGTKDVREITRLADKLFDWVMEEESKAPAGLIEKLRDVLCDGGKS